MKRVTAFALFVLLALALSGPVAHAGTKSAQTKAQKNAQKSWKKYSKQDNKRRKKELKAEGKQMKKWNKNRPTITTT